MVPRTVYRSTWGGASEVEQQVGWDAQSNSALIAFLGYYSRVELEILERCNGREN